MSDLQLLFLVLGALYAWECACWVRRGGVLFRSWTGKRWRAAHPGRFLGNPSAGFVFAAPLPPLGTIHTANQVPLSATAEGVLTYVSSSVNPGGRPPQIARHFLWQDIRSIEPRGRNIRINGVPVVRVNSTTYARDLAQHLEKVRSSPVDQRAEVLRNWMRVILDPEPIARRQEDYRKAAKPVVGLANALFVHVYLIAPILISLVGFRRCWLPLAIGLVGLTWITAFAFVRAHRRLYSDEPDERFTLGLTVALSPPTAARAHDALSRPLLETFHPLALALALCSDSDARVFAALILKELRFPAHPVYPSDDPAATRAEHWARQEMMVAVEAVLERQGIKPAELLHAPKAEDPGCRSYCPRCGAQYTDAVGACADCGGLPLAPLV